MIDTSVITSTALNLANLILVNPKKDAGITTLPEKSFLFDFNGEEIVTLTSEVTDHFVESNFAVQDHIALKPEIITISGFVAELNDVTPAFLEPLKTVADRLSTLSPFLPAISSSALIAYNTAAQLYATANSVAQRAVNQFDSLGPLGSAFGLSAQTQTKQALAFNKFYGWFLGRRLFNVQTPWQIFQDMVIMSLKATQNEETKMISDFEITFKKMRFADTTIAGKKVAKHSGRSSALASTPLELGNINASRDKGIGELFPKQVQS